MGQLLVNVTSITLYMVGRQTHYHVTFINDIMHTLFISPQCNWFWQNSGQWPTYRQRCSCVYSRHREVCAETTWLVSELITHRWCRSMLVTAFSRTHDKATPTTRLWEPNERGYGRHGAGQGTTNGDGRSVLWGLCRRQWVVETTTFCS